MFGRNQTRKDIDAAGLDVEVVVAPSEADPAHLRQAQATTLRPILEGQLFENNDAMRNTVKLEIVFCR